MAQTQAPTRLEGIIQKMIDANESDEDIQAVIKEFEKQYPDEVKTAVDRAKVAEPVPFVGPEAPPEPPHQPSFAESILTWPNAVRFGASTIGDLSAPVTFGTGPFIGGAIGEGIGRAMEGQPFDPSIMALEGALNYIPGGGKVERAGLKGIIEQGARSARHGAIQGGIGVFPRHQANEGNLFSPTKWTMPSVGEVGGQIAGGALIGGTVGAGMKAAKPIGKVLGTPVAAVGRGMSAEKPFFTGLLPWPLNVPTFKTMERGVGGWVENLGENMKAGGRDARMQNEIDEFYGKNSPDAQNPIIRISSTRVGGARDPIMESPITTPDSEVPELQQFRESTNRNAWDPEETTVNETSDPIQESPINPPDSEVDALRQLHQSSTGRWQPPPTTINEAPLGPFDRAPLSEEPAPPEPPPAPEVPPPNVGTGSAFERAMQEKAAAERAAGRDPSVGVEAPPVDVTGRPVEPPLSFESQGLPEGLPKVAKGQQISVNPDGDLLWPGIPSANVISRVEVLGYRFERKTNTFRKINPSDGPPVVSGDEPNNPLDPSGERGAMTFDPEAFRDAFNKLKQILGRDPTNDEVLKHIASEFRPSEQSPPDMDVPETGGLDVASIRQQSTMGGPAHGPMPEPSAGNTAIDPNEIWNNLWRLNEGKPPTHEQLMDALGREGFKPGQRLEEVRNETANRGWTDQIRSVLDKTGDKFTKESPTWPKSVKDMLLEKLNEDAKKPYVERPRALGDAAEDLHDAYVWGSERSSIEKRIAEVKQFINDATDVETAKKNRDDLGTIADNSDEAGKAALDALYDIADAHYRRLRNPELESSRPNQAKPLEDIFRDNNFDPHENITDPDAYDRAHNPDLYDETGKPKKQPPYPGSLADQAQKLGIDSDKFPDYDDLKAEIERVKKGDKYGPKAEIPPIDKWDTGPIKPFDKDMPIETTKSHYDTPGDIDLLRQEIAEIERRLKNPELKKDGTRKYSDKVYEQDRKDLAQAKKDLAERLEREDQPFDPDTRPSNLPAGHVDIEGTRFIDLNQNMKMSEPGESTPKQPPKKRTPSEQNKFARKSDDLWKVLIGGDKPKYWVESNLKAEELINKTTDRETLESYAEALDEWAKDHTKDTDHRMAGWMMDLRKLVMKKLEE